MNDEYAIIIRLFPVHHVAVVVRPPYARPPLSRKRLMLKRAMNSYASFYHQKNHCNNTNNLVITIAFGLGFTY